MPPLSSFDELIVHTLEETRSVKQTATALRLPEPEVQKVAMMAFGLGRLEVNLADF